jgi:hypothetical protein
MVLPSSSFEPPAFMRQSHESNFKNYWRLTMTQSETAYDHYESYVDQLGQLRALNWLLYINIKNNNDFSHYSSGIYGISEGLADKLETVCNHMHERMVTLEEIGDELISDGKPKTWLTKEETKQAGKGFPKAVPYHEFFNLDKATGEPLPEKEPTPKQDQPAFDLPALPPAPTPAKTPIPNNAAPVWILPLMRLLKGDAQGDLTKAWADLPAHLPKGTNLPNVDEAASTLIRLGLV